VESHRGRWATVFAQVQACYCQPAEAIRRQTKAKPCQTSGSMRSSADDVGVCSHAAATISGHSLPWPMFTSPPEGVALHVSNCRRRRCSVKRKWVAGEATKTNRG